MYARAREAKLTLANGTKGMSRNSGGRTDEEAASLLLVLDVVAGGPHRSGVSKIGGRLKLAIVLM